MIISVIVLHFWRVFFYMKTTSDPKSEVQEVSLKFYFTPKKFIKSKINAFKQKLQKSVIFDNFGIFGLKTNSDHISEVLKVAFTSDFTSENIFEFEINFSGSYKKSGYFLTFLL